MIAKPGSYPVKLDGRVVGHITQRASGWCQYFAKGQKKGGDVFASFTGCLRSLGPGVTCER